MLALTVIKAYMLALTAIKAYMLALTAIKAYMLALTVIKAYMLALRLRLRLIRLIYRIHRRTGSIKLTRFHIR
jgi:hypothetical protein